LLDSRVLLESSLFEEFGRLFGFRIPFF
jgi:hypothetical protein